MFQEGVQALDAVLEGLCRAAGPRPQSCLECTDLRDHSSEDKTLGKVTMHCHLLTWQTGAS